MTAPASVPTRYSGATIALHWTTAALIGTLFILGWRMVALPLSPQKFEFYALHKSLGLVVLALTGLRFAVRLALPAPAATDGPTWQRYAASGTHALLYALLLALPLSGWMFNSVVGFPLSLFGLTNLPPLAAPQPALKEIARLTHVWFGWCLLTLLSLHIAAALHHHFIRRDGILGRMLPRSTRSARTTRRPA